MSVVERLKQHAFAEFLTTRGAPATEAWFERLQDGLAAGKLEFGMPLKLADEQNYLWRVNHAFDALLRATLRLEQSRAFLSGLSRSFDQTGAIPRTQAIEYHVAYYTVTITSLVDMALVLVNQAFRLGIAPKECKWHVLVKNDWVVWTGVAEELKRIDNLVQKYRTARNAHVHSGSRINVGEIVKNEQYPFYVLVELAHELHARIPVEADPDQVRESLSFLENGYAKILEAICGTIDADLAAWEGCLTALLNKLLPPVSFWFGVNEGVRSILQEAAAGLEAPADGDPQT